jgi:uncharacterized protein (DUF427 family)
MKAIWNGTVVAESDDTVVVEGEHYFPESALQRNYLLPSNTKRSTWKGEARYYNLFVDGDVAPDAVWYYPEPTEAAAQIKGRVAFGRGVKIEE